MFSLELLWLLYVDALLCCPAGNGSLCPARSTLGGAPGGILAGLAPPTDSVCPLLPNDKICSVTALQIWLAAGMGRPLAPAAEARQHPDRLAILRIESMHEELRRCRHKVEVYYAAQLAFYTCSIFMLVVWEERRKDFRIMMLHHVSSVILIMVSHMAG